MENIYIVGAETVQSAAHIMERAANEMKHAAGQFESALQSHERFLNDWLSQFERIMEALKK